MEMNVTPERLNALEQQLTAAMELDSSRDIYFDRHGEDVIRELIAALSARPEAVRIVEALDKIIVWTNCENDTHYQCPQMDSIQNELRKLRDSLLPQPSDAAKYCQECDRHHTCVRAGTCLRRRDAAACVSPEEKK